MSEPEVKESVPKELNDKASAGPSDGQASENNNVIKGESDTVNGLEPKTKKAKLSVLDPWYEFEEVEPESVQEDLNYKPSFFLRTHSKNDNPADVQTQIWQCSFPPQSCLGNIVSSDVVTTCGGSSVCFIDVTSGDVQLKYNRSAKSLASENLYALAWSSLEVVNDEFVDLVNPEKISGQYTKECTRSSVVAAAGGKCTVVLIDVEAGYCYDMFRTGMKANAIVCSLLFHPKKQSWLFCGHEDGHIQIWDIGLLSRPNYSQTKCERIMTLPGVSGDVYNMQYCHRFDLLLAGCDASLVVYKIDAQKIMDGKKCSVTQVNLPYPDHNPSTVVDSIVTVRDTVLAVKCALHAQIYLFDIGLILERETPVTDISNVDLSMKLTYDDVVCLEWSSTDNYYMNMGADPKSCTLVCGDDKGTLWLYDLCDIVRGVLKSPLHGSNSVDSFPPTAKLLWPNLDDPEVEKAGKLRLDSYDIVVDKCCVSDGAKHVVAVTNNNMVCIWTKVNKGTEGI